MNYYEGLYLRYLKLGIKKFNLRFKELDKYIEQEQKSFKSNSDLAINGILAGEKYSTFNLIKRESGDLINKEVLVKLLKKELNGKDVLKTENILFYINYLKIRLDEEIVAEVRSKFSDEKISNLLDKNQGREQKVKDAEDRLEKGHHYNAYVLYKFAGSLTSAILDKIIHTLIEKKNYLDLAKVLDSEDKALPKGILKEVGDLALNQESRSSFFYYFKLDSKEDFVDAVKKLFPTLTKDE